MMLCLSILAQELKVKSFSLAATDISAQTQQRRDLNDEPCALVKVQFVGVLLDVEGNVIKPFFSSFGISQVEKNRTYVLVLSKPVGQHSYIVAYDGSDI